MNPICYALVSLFLYISSCQSFSTSVESLYAFRLKAWSLQMPENFGTFKSTWYNEVDNYDLLRTKTYDDFPNDFQIVAAGSDWSSASEISEAKSPSLKIESRICLNPIRRARRWLARRRS